MIIEIIVIKEQVGVRPPMASRRRAWNPQPLGWDPHHSDLMRANMEACFPVSASTCWSPLPLNVLYHGDVCVRLWVCVCVE